MYQSVIVQCFRTSPPRRFTAHRVTVAFRVVRRVIAHVGIRAIDLFGS